MVNEAEIEDVEDIDESDEEGSNKSKGGKSVVLVHNFAGYCIYRSSMCFVIKKPGGTQCGYFTSLGSCVSEIEKLMLVDKAMNRDNHMKKNMDSLIGVIEQHTDVVRKLVAELNDITVKAFEEKKEKAVRVKKVE